MVDVQKMLRAKKAACLLHNEKSVKNWEVWESAFFRLILE